MTADPAHAGENVTMETSEQCYWLFLYWKIILQYLNICFQPMEGIYTFISCISCYETGSELSSEE